VLGSPVAVVRQFILEFFARTVGMNGKQEPKIERTYRDANHSVCAMRKDKKQGSKPSRSDEDGSCNKWWVERCVIALISYHYHNQLFDNREDGDGKFKIDWKKTAEVVNKKMRVTVHGPFSSDQVGSAVVNSMEFPYDDSCFKRRPRMEVDYPLLNNIAVRNATKTILLERCLVKCKGDLYVLDMILSTLHEDFLQESGLTSILEVRPQMPSACFALTFVVCRSCLSPRRSMKSKAMLDGCKHSALLHPTNLTNGKFSMLGACQRRF
jgi:hypothetical protein